MLTELLSAGEPEAFGRGQKMREYIRVAAPALNLSQTWDIEVAAMLGQVGLMTLPPIIMQKVHGGVALIDREKEMVLRLPEIGYKVLSKITRLGPAAQIVLYQNKNFDGSGFPKDTIAEARIPKGSRLLRILLDLVDLEAKGIAKRQAFEQMRANRRFYVMALFETTVGTLITHEAPASGSALAVKDLLPGHELLSAVETLDGRLIAPAGTILSPMMLERFNNFAELSGIKEPIHVKRK
jgi:hypothetical protein